MALTEAQRQLLLREKAAGRLSPEDSARLDAELSTPVPMGFTQKLGAAAQGVGEFAVDTARTGALPTAGGLAGAALGAPFGPPGVIAGESIGSMAGEGVNQLFGITEPSLTQIGLAGAGGPLLRGAQGVYRAARPAIAKNLVPGAAPVLHEIGQETLERLPTQIGQGAMVTDTLWSQVDRLAPGAKVVTTHLDNAAQKLQGIYGKSALYEPTSAEGKVLEKIRDLNTRYLNDVPFDVLDATRKDIGHLTRSTDDKTRKIGDTLYAAIERDYDAFQSMKGRPAALVKTLREARRASLDDMVAERVQKIILPRYSGETGGVKVTPATTMRRLRQDEWLRDRLTPAQEQLIEDAIKKIQGLPAFPPDRGVMYGSGRNVMTFLSGFGGASGFGVGPGKAALAGAGLSMGIAAATKLAMHPLGQRQLRRMIDKTGPQIDPRALVGMYNMLLSRGAREPGD